jgi:hypothetical protein
LLTDDHQACVVWRFVEGLDLTDLYARIRAVEGLPPGLQLPVRHGGADTGEGLVAVVADGAGGRSGAAPAAEAVKR